MIAAVRYQRTQTETASKERVLVLLLAGARRAMFVADGELGMNRPGHADAHVRKAIDIINELRATLDPSHAQALCETLDALYGFITERLLQALKGDRKALDDARRVFAPIADAFEQVVASGAGAQR